MASTTAICLGLFGQTLATESQTLLQMCFSKGKPFQKPDFLYKHAVVLGSPITFVSSWNGAWVVASLETRLDSCPGASQGQAVAGVSRLNGVVRMMMMMMMMMMATI